MKMANNRCKAFHVFQHWQLDRLWPAIAEDRYYMGTNLQRTVDLKEAERDFFDHDGYGCPEKWRAEFCSRHCPHRNKCGLAFGFIAMGKKHVVPPLGGQAIPENRLKARLQTLSSSYAFSAETAHVLNGGMK